MRIAWVFGVNGSNFIKTMFKVGSTHDEVKIVNDQIGTPTWPDAVRRYLDILKSKVSLMS